jgi:hypothetical protein
MNMNKTDITRLAKQMLAVEQAPHDEELARRHVAEWVRVPWKKRALVVKEVKRLEQETARLSPT